MRFVYFTQSIRSCWNHGNVHFLRGVARALLRSGHAITIYEPEDGWEPRESSAQPRSSGG